MYMYVSYMQSECTSAIICPQGSKLGTRTGNVTMGQMGQDWTVVWGPQKCCLMIQGRAKPRTQKLEAGVGYLRDPPFILPDITC